MTNASDVDPGTPVLVGVGQVSERIGQPGYRALSPVELAAEAARRALADALGETGAIAASIDTVAGVRQFENSYPGARAPLGRSDNYPRSVANRIGATPATAILEVVGGQSPQHLVTELAATIAEGGSQVALVFGAEAISTVRHFAGTSEAPDFTEQTPGQLTDRGFGLDGLITEELLRHGLTEVSSQYALCENARRAATKQTREQYLESMGELFAPFTKVAAANPHAAAPTERSSVELVTPTERNRPIADPYPRYLVARDQVNQGAAVLLMSVAAADRLGVPVSRRVFLCGHADLHEPILLARPDLGSSPASILSVRTALDMAGLDIDQLTTLDLYSCFPIAVFTITDAFGLRPDDPRGLTLTGGLPFFGGAGNNYSMHAIAETITRARTAPGTFGLVGANGGALSKYSTGIYSTTPTHWTPSNSATAQAKLDAAAPTQRNERPDGPATIETYTMLRLNPASRSSANYGRDGGTGIVVGRSLDGARFLATTIDGDQETLDLLRHDEPLGAPIHVRTFDYGNRVSTTEARMNQLLPRS